MKVLWYSFAVIVLDQFSKFYIKGIKIPSLNINLTGMFPGESISVIGNFFKITFTENPGMAFGYDPGSDFKFWISLFSLLASIGLLIYLFFVKTKPLSLKISIALILGGAVGNLIDRTFYGLIYNYAPVFYGKVVDFLDFDFFNFSLLGRSYDRFPIFNLADASVTIGVLILIFFYRQHKKSEEPEIESNTPGDLINNADVENKHLVAGLTHNDAGIIAQNQTGDSGNEQNDKGKEI